MCVFVYEENVDEVRAIWQVKGFVFGQRCRARICRTLDLTTQKKSSGAAHLCEHTVDTHTHTYRGMCWVIVSAWGERVYKEITASRTAAVGLSLNSHSLDKLSRPPGEMGLIFAKLWSFFCNQGKRWCSDRFVASVFDCCPPRGDIQRNWANVNASELV